MEFVIHYTLETTSRDAAQQRFLAGGAPPPEGVKMTGRWHCVQGHEGFLVCQADDAAAIATWMQEWTDLLRFRVLPVVDDETMAGVLGVGDSG